MLKCKQWQPSLVDDVPLETLEGTPLFRFNLHFFFFMGLLLRPKNLRVEEVLAVELVVGPNIAESYFHFVLLKLSQLLVNVKFF